MSCSLNDKSGTLGPESLIRAETQRQFMVKAKHANFGVKSKLVF